MKINGIEHIHNVYLMGTCCRLDLVLSGKKVIYIYDSCILRSAFNASRFLSMGTTHPSLPVLRRRNSNDSRNQPIIRGSYKRR